MLPTDVWWSTAYVQVTRCAKDWHLVAARWSRGWWPASQKNYQTILFSKSILQVKQNNHSLTSASGNWGLATVTELSLFLDIISPSTLEVSHPSSCVREIVMSLTPEYLFFKLFSEGHFGVMESHSLSVIRSLDIFPWILFSLWI